MSETVYEYEGTRRVSYDFGDEFGIAVFVPVCPECGRFVKAATARVDRRHGAVGEASCSRCGVVSMPFEGWFGPEELDTDRLAVGEEKQK